MARHRKPGPIREVAGRLVWSPGFPGPWVGFRNVTEYRTWARDIRKARPGTKTEVNMNIGWTAEALLAQVRRDSPIEEQRLLAPPYPADW